MKIVDIILFSKSLQKDTLSYFSAKDVKIGDLVEVSVRNKKNLGLVINITDAEDLKSGLKRESFHLKKIDTIVGSSVFSPDFFKSCLLAKKYFASSLNEIFYTLVPNLFLEKYTKIQKKDLGQKNKNQLQSEKFVLQDTLPERLEFYKKSIRESFSKNESVFICLPNQNDIQIFENHLSKGIEDYTVSLYGDLPEKESLNLFNKILSEKHPLLILATGSYLFIPRNDIGLLVVEKESSGNYHSFQKPYLDFRIFAEILASQSKIKFILADNFLRVETIHRKNIGELDKISSFSYRISETPLKKTFDLKKDDLSEKKKFTIFDKEVREQILNAIDQNKKILLFTSRKGKALTTVCNDCKEILMCDECDVPLVLYKTNKGTFFSCNYCKKQKDSLLSCPKCTSWNMVPLGIGTDGVFEEISRILGDEYKKKIFIFDKEKIKTKVQARKTIDDFKKNGLVIIGTEMVLSYIKEKFDLSVIVSFDSLLSIPDFSINEKIMHLLLNIKDQTKDLLLIQTRHSENKILNEFMSGDLRNFVDEELNQRKKFFYPPFSRIIKITSTTKESLVGQVKKRFLEIFQSYSPLVFAAFIPKIKNKYLINAVIKIAKEDWSLSEISKGQIDLDLSQKLSSLSFNETVRIDPENLL